ncbi:hypothetical protein SEA_JONJAMES_190 [Gordonia Phage JonJames]|nr:hypothetical protein SEA_JONJAMES_190 [Gordonia Phage JonJames]
MSDLNFSDLYRVSRPGKATSVDVSAYLIRHIHDTAVDINPHDEGTRNGMPDSFTATLEDGITELTFTRVLTPTTTN